MLIMFWMFSAQDIRYKGWQCGTISNIMHKICDSTVANFISNYFSSTADIVSRAYPMPSRPSVCQPFFKSSRLPFMWSFWYLAWMCTAIFLKKSCESTILIFFLWILDKKKIGKQWEFWRFLAILSKSFLCWTMKLKQDYNGCFQLCVKNGPCGPFFFSNRPQIGQFIGFCQFAGNYFNGFTRNF